MEIIGELDGVITVSCTGGTFKISAEDIHLLDRLWHRNKLGYICSSRSISLHRIIMGCQRGDGIHIDHINGDPSDNRRANLRTCVHGENMRNAKKKLFYGDRPTTSRFRGVSWDKTTGKWVAMICCHRRFNLGYFSSEIDAARAYNAAALKHHGAFASLNII